MVLGGVGGESSLWSDVVDSVLEKGVVREYSFFFFVCFAEVFVFFVFFEII